MASTITNSSRVLLIPIGIAGSGKSTYMDKLILKLKSENRTVDKVSADDYLGLYSNLGEIDLSKLSLAHSSCLRKVFELMENRVENIIVDNTNLNVHKWYEYLYIACNNDYRVYFMLPKYGLIYYNIRYNSIDKQLELIKKNRSVINDKSKPKIVPAGVIEKQYRDFQIIKKFVNDNKVECQCDPHLWLKLCE
jgi:hypothetical protein